MTNNQGSFAKTVFYSFVYGVAGLITASRLLEVDESNHSDITAILLASVGALIGFILASFVHELAHFFTAKLLGTYVRKIQIGSGSLIATFQITGTRCDVHESLRSGAVHYLLISAKYARLKMFLITSAAPLASLLLAAAFIELLINIQPDNPSPSAALYYCFPILAGITAPCILFLPGVLVPYRFQFSGHKLESDALRLINIPRLSDDKIAAMVEGGQAALSLSQKHDVATMSLREALVYADFSPKDIEAISTALAFLKSSNDPRVPEFFEKLIALQTSPSERHRVLDEYITWNLETDKVSNHSKEMDELSLELLNAEPENISLRGTRGSVLIDLGRIEEGKALLNEVLARTDSPIDKSYSSIFLALAAKSEGQLDLAVEYALAARTFDPTCPALKRLNNILPMS